MQIDHCLILAAGFGTRMGTIGQKLPKVLWPVFERSLLELQVAYARSLGVKNIYINLHYMGEQIEAFCKGKSVFDGVTFLWEKPEILDIGGAVHNLASQKSVNYKGRLLVLNADQFFYVPKDDLLKLLDRHKSSPATLFTYWVNTSHGYNALEMDEKRQVKALIKNKDLPANTRVETYTGISFIDLPKLEPVKGVSAFFDTVCPFTKKPVDAILLDKIDYWDFGTIQRYWDTCFRILETYSVNSTHPFLRFLVSERALKTWKIDLLKYYYNATSPRVINLAPDKLSMDLNQCIVMGPTSVRKMNNPSIWLESQVEELKAGL